MTTYQRLTIPAMRLAKGDLVVSKTTGNTAEVFEVTVMASGVAVTLDTEYGSVARVYNYDENLTVKRPDESLNMNTLMGRILAVLPEATFEQDNEGQVVIYTNLRVTDTEALVSMDD